MDSIVNEVELFAKPIRNGKHIVLGIVVKFVQLEAKAIACDLKMRNQLIARISHKPKEIPINPTLRAVVVKILHQLTLIHSGTSIIPKLPLGVPDPSHINVVPANNPALPVMIAGHVSHVVNSVHIVGRRDVAVHHVVG